MVAAATKEKDGKASAERDAKFKKRQRELAQKSARLNAEWEEAKAHAAALKSERDATRAEAERHALEDDSQLELPLGDDKPEPWRDTPIGEAVKLTDKQIEKLAEADITTVGDLEDVRAGKNRDYQELTDIPGVGKALAEKLEEAVMDFVAQASMESNDQDEEDEDDED